jgi:hypothetical protein
MRDLTAGNDSEQEGTKNCNAPASTGITRMERREHQRPDLRAVEA